MRNIAIVEDEDAAAALLESYVKQYAEAERQAFTVDRYRDAVSFLDGYKAKYAVVFMDIQMPLKDGMTAAEELRAKDKSVSIVFITNLTQYARRGYEVDAVAYLIKPVGYYDFALKFRKALDVYVMYGEKNITLNTAGGLTRFSSDKLMYVEVVSHRLRYHLVDDVIEMTGTLGRAEEELSGFGFLRCNQCYLVNPKFVVTVKKLSVQVGNETLAISRPRRNAFLSELANWYAGANR